MRLFTPLVVLLLFSSCSLRRKGFSKEEVCAPSALRYLQSPRAQEKAGPPMEATFLSQLDQTQTSMQTCYNDFIRRRGREEFRTCLVVGVDKEGRREYFNFSSKDVPLDQEFLNCAANITKNLPYSQYGRNYVLIQSYHFYYK